MSLTKPWAARPAAQWCALVLTSALLAALLLWWHFPAAVLLGCMLSGILLATHEVRLKVAPRLFSLAQGVVGCLMASSLQSAALARVADNWPVFLLGASSVIFASALLGWVLMRRQVFPGTTAVWGLAPGAASAMVLMADAYGADMRLVAFMQYLRVATVTLTAALVARWFGAGGAAAGGSVHWLVLGDAGHLGATLALIVVCVALARWRSIPGGALVLPLLSATGLQAAGLLVIELPPLLLALAYAAIGWSVGLRFSREIFLYALRALPQVLGAILALIGVGLGMAALLHGLAGLDPLTAYLAASPGGADSVAVIAATSMVDAGFVMAMQLVRFLMVLVFGPQVSKFVATRSR